MSSESGAPQQDRSFYLLEEAMCVIGETGEFRAYATAGEVRARLLPKLPNPPGPDAHNPLLLGESVNIWTVQRGRLATGVDVAEHVTARFPDGATATLAALNRHALDFSAARRTDPPPASEGVALTLHWAGLLSLLPELSAPLAAEGDEGLMVRLDGERPAPELLSYAADLVEALAEAEDWPWTQRLGYGTPYAL